MDFQRFHISDDQLSISVWPRYYSSNFSQKSSIHAEVYNILVIQDGGRPHILDFQISDDIFQFLCA